MDSFPPGARRVPRVPSRSRLCSTWTTGCFGTIAKSDYCQEINIIPTVARPTQPEKIALKEDLGWPASPTLKLFSTATLQIVFLTLVNCYNFTFAGHPLAFEGSPQSPTEFQVRSFSSCFWDSSNQIALGLGLTWRASPPAWSSPQTTITLESAGTVPQKSLAISAKPSVQTLPKATHAVFSFRSPSPGLKAWA